MRDGQKKTPVKCCPLIAFSQAAGGKYKMRILWELKEGPRRYGELRRSAIVAARGAPVTPRTLSRELKELQSRGLIDRKQYNVVPPKVEYRLTLAGKSLIPVVKQIVRWGLTTGQEVALKQAQQQRETNALA
jgi:DNA-binding HxlR family transcriptional regulator